MVGLLTAGSYPCSCRCLAPSERVLKSFVAQDPGLASACCRGRAARWGRGGDPGARGHLAQCPWKATV